MNKIRRCQQTKCVFFLRGNCRPCESCNSKPYEINTRCARCLGCETREGASRFDFQQEQEEEAERMAKQIYEKLIEQAR